ncbi:MAG: hypothetical protein KGQ59_10065 [Bdellovibrionales bacterium]|nr:hypothetical protein [Bdellovibrionales bacterium]
MTSDKWFDWDNSGASETGSPSVTQEQSSKSTQPSPQDAQMSPGQSEGFDSFDPTSSSPETPPMEGAIPELGMDPPELGAQALNIQPEPAPVAEASRPFHLWIRGQLKSHEKDQLVDLLARENFGIREVDLEIQFEAGQVLLPRISEYAAVLVVQTLRGASVEFELLPSEMALADGAPKSLPKRFPHTPQTVSTLDHPAESLPITKDPFLPGHENAQIFDQLVATGLIREPEWNAESNDSYSQMVEALKRELRFKAHLKKADGLVHFEAKILASPWISETECRVQVSASAVRFST